MEIRFFKQDFLCSNCCHFHRNRSYCSGKKNSERKIFNFTGKWKQVNVGIDLFYPGNQEANEYDPKRPRSNEGILFARAKEQF